MCQFRKKQKYIELFLKNHDIFSRNKDDLGRANNFEHEIHLKNKEPTFVKQFKIPEAHRDQLEAQIKEWQKIGVVEPTNSRYNSPICCPQKGWGNQVRA